jgi:hypothetical protein
LRKGLSRHCGNAGALKPEDLPALSPELVTQALDPALGELDAGGGTSAPGVAPVGFQDLSEVGLAEVLELPSGLPGRRE